MVLRSKLALLWGAAMVLLAAVVSGGVAQVITYGQADGDKHPNVAPSW